MKIIEATEEILRRIEFRDLEKSDLGDNLNQSHIDFFMSSDFKRAVMKGEQVVMVMGGKMDEKSCHTWLVASSLIHENPVASLEMILEVEKDAISKLSPDLLFTFNLPEFPAAIKFLNRVGYKAQGITGDFEDGRERILLVKEVSYGSK